MQTYVFALLKRGPKALDPALDLDALQAGHMEHIKLMKQRGILLLAGPFADGDDARGLYIFDSESIEDVRKVAEADPAVVAGRIRLEYLTLLVPPGTSIRMGEIPF